MAFWRKFNFHSESSIDALLASASIGNSAAASSPASSPLTLEQLLDEDELLQECKNGHARLVEFLSRPKLVRRLLAYVSGDAFDSDSALQQDDRWNEEQTRRRRKFPYLCAEILLADVWSITEAVFATPADTLAPFWDAILDKPPDQLAQNTILTAHWVRVNSFWLEGARLPQVVAFLQSYSNPIDRLLAHIPHCSPISDFLVRLIARNEAHSIIPWLSSQQLIPKTIALLSPRLSNDHHSAASELLKSIIATATPLKENKLPATVPASDSAGQVEAQVKAPGWASQTQKSGQLEDEVWPDNTLVRELVSADNVATLTSFMFPPSTAEFEDWVQVDSASDSMTSSLVNIISVILDVIRKNNSDWIEHQILQITRKEAQEEEENVQKAKDMDEEVKPVARKALPNVVNLGQLLFQCVEHLPEIQQLLKDPRSSTTPVRTTVGQIKPFTLERFRICELYAELLHCSNMLLNNRHPHAQAPTYSQAGSIDGTRSEIIAALEWALFVPQPQSSPVEPPPVSPASPTVTRLHRILTNAAAANSSSAFSAISDATSSYSSPHLAANESDDDNFGDVESPAISPISPISPNLASIGTTFQTIMSKKSEDSPLTPTMPCKSTPGDTLRKAYSNIGVVESLIEMFFEYPWNNFLHNVVYDLVQQILQGRMDRDTNIFLVKSVLVNGKLMQRILDASSQYSDTSQATRPAYMGHITLLSEEIARFATTHPSIISSLPLPLEEWEKYVSTHLTTIRERDNRPLGGGLSKQVLEAVRQQDQELSDEDDEWPSKKASETTQKRISSIDDVSDAVSGVKAHFAQYLSSQMSTLAKKLESDSSDDEEEDAAGWLGDSYAQRSFDDDSKAFGFDDRFDSPGRATFTKNSSLPAVPSSNVFAEDTFDPFSDAAAISGPAKLTPADWNASFTSSVDAGKYATTHEAISSDEDDDFGDFETATDKAFGDYDFGAFDSAGGSGRGDSDEGVDEGIIGKVMDTLSPA